LQETPTHENDKKEIVGRARRLLQYCRLPDKHSRSISRDIWNFCGISIYLFIYSFIYLFQDFSLYA